MSKSTKPKSKPLPTPYDESVRNFGPFDPHLVVGIDPGKHTGFAVWNRNAQMFEQIHTCPIHTAWAWFECRDISGGLGEIKLVVIEDARQRGGSPKAAMGAGSIRRDSTIWEDYLKYLGVPYVMKMPNRATNKWSREQFELVTHWTAPTDEHGRDAAMLVFQN